MRSFVQRTVITAAALPLLFIALYFSFLDHLLMLGIVLAASVLATLEMIAITQKDESKNRRAVLLAVNCLLPILFYLYNADFIRNVLHPDLLRALLGLGIAVSAAVLVSIDIFGGTFSRSAQSIGRRLLIMVYPGVCISFTFFILALRRGAFMLALFLIIVWGNDIFAYLIGKALGGKNKLHLPVSPWKSVAGFVGGVVMACALAAGYHLLFGGKIPFSLPGTLILAFITACGADIGDLFESMLKRSAYVKDSGVLIGAMGGILDGVDSTLYCLPVFYFLAVSLVFFLPPG